MSNEDVQRLKAQLEFTSATLLTAAANHANLIGRYIDDGLRRAAQGRQKNAERIPKPHGQDASAKQHSFQRFRDERQLTR
jgi:hypothetical protein